MNDIPGWAAEALRGSGGEDGRLWAEFVFAADSPVFAGHFPGNPVLPAVVQMALVRLVAERGTGRGLVPLRQERSRFTGMVGPGQCLRVELAVSGEDGVCVDFTLACGDGDKAVARGRVFYREAEDGP